MSGVLREAATAGVGEAELEGLVERYRFGSTDLVDFGSLCDDVDEVFTIKGLERKPSDPVHLALESDPTYYDQIGLADPQLSEPQRAALERTLREVGAAVKTTGAAAFKDSFVDFDRNNDGCITRNEFIRAAQRLHRTVSERVANFLADAYAVGKGVHFRALQSDMESIGALGDGLGLTVGGAEAEGLHLRRANVSGALRAAERDAACWRGDASSEMAQLERSLALHALERRLRLDVHFLEFDAGRRGSCARAQFAQALRRTFAVKISGAAMDALADRYEERSGMVCYGELCVSLELRRDELLSLKKGERSGASQSAFPPPFQIAATLEEIRRKMGRKRVQLAPSFQDFDPRRNEHVTRHQFERALAQFGLLPPEKGQLRMLLDAYAATDGRHPSEVYCNYKTFLQHLRQDDRTNTTRPSSYHSTTLGSSSSLPGIITNVSTPLITSSRDGQSDALLLSRQSNRSVPQLVQHVRCKVLQHRVRLQEFFRDDDPLHRGVVTRSQFYRGLRAAVDGIVSECESDLLCDAYASDTAALDARGRPYVRWVQFVSDVDKVFTAYELERRPEADADAEMAMARSGTDLGAAAHFDREGLSGLAGQAVAKLAEVVRVRGLLLPPFFKAFDRANRGSVRETHFLRVLSTAGLLGELSSRECAALTQYYVRPDQLGESSRPPPSQIDSADIAYTAFLRDLGSSNPKQPGDTQTYGKRLKQTASTKTLPPRCVVEDLVRQLGARRARLEDFLTDGDKLRSGEISAARFRSALGRAGLALTQDSLDSLCAHFQSRKHRDQVNWHALLAELEDCANDLGRSDAQNLTDRQRASGGRSGFAAQRANDANALSPEEHTALAALLARLRAFIAQRRLNVKPYFQDYDKHNLCGVSREQLSAVLDKMQLKVTPNEIQLLFATFQIHEGLHPLGKTFFNYKNFVRQVDATEKY